MFFRSAALVAGILVLAVAVGASAAGAVRDRTATLPGTTPSSLAPTSAVIPASQGSVRWRFRVSGQYVLHRPAVGPDGGVVVASSSGDVYSLTADGALRWTMPSIGSDGGPSIGADGTVYVASLSTITAIAPDGSIKWSYTEPSAGQGVIAGPTVGPDGNVYVISDVGGLGAFALSPAGDLLWSNPGNPTFIEYGQIGAELVFGSGRLYAAFDQGLAGPSTMFGLSLGGTQEWARTIGGTDDPFMQQQRPAGDRGRRQPLSDGFQQPSRLGLAAARREHRRHSLGLLPVTRERDVPSKRGPGRLGVLLPEPFLPRVGDFYR
jgi:hypothetical protein